MKFCYAGSFALSLFILVSTPASSQVSVSPDPVIIKQPDKSLLTIVGKGSSLNPHTETIDGYTIILNHKGYYVYAYLNKQQIMAISKKVAHNPEDRSKCEQRYIAKKLTPHLRRKNTN